MKGFVLTSILLLTSVLISCSTTTSDNVDTDGIYAVLTIQEDGANTRADATFYVGGMTGTVLQLTAGDSVTCNGNAMTENQDLFGKYYYYGNCGTLTAGATYTFTFTRNGDDGPESYSSSVVMPAAITISSPNDGATFTRGQTIPVTWNAGSDTVEVSISGSGTSASGSGSTTYSRSHGSLDDDGAYTILATDTDPDDTITGVIANAAISVTRSRSGTMASGLDGQISARRADAVSNLTLNP
ncbi:Ig-like domain-containing protein [Bdellovibrio sp. HCB337]|uniref:Ig-like domain-containing protein n=1 Tax=Bdellovibrio sp. HCB337 TaxID=3394358 RepID=UPI0039A55C13